MRLELLASAIIVMTASPAFAQCLYVACNHDGQNVPVHQAPVHQAPISVSGYNEGYAAGLAAQTASRHVHTSRAAIKPKGMVRPAATAHAAHRTAKRSPANHAVRTIPRHAARRAPARVVHATSHPTRPFHDPIKDRAATYHAPIYGQGTSMASLMSRTSSYYASSSTISWQRPVNVTSEGGQICGWGARTVTNAHGQAQRTSAWLCQCSQGWRPPGH